ncbi:MAG: class I SAM-dependent RNA methyltransferase [Candidatus Aenigmarchaeota archaeon]|nr:class I SAM-dependent RNA methyltransferase [Candidatus Aenigmarchaeota archaeon]
MKEFEFIATCTRGLERVTIEEIKELIGSTARIEREGAVRFKSKLAAVYTLNYVARSIHRVILLLHSSKFQTLEDIYAKTKRIDFSEWINDDQTFAIRAQRMGNHQFTSVDVARVAGQAVIDSFLESEGKRLKVDLNEPDIIIRVYVKDDSLLIGLDTTGDESLHKRGYRVYQHPAPLKPTIAYCLVRVSKWKENESLLDPMCGSGTIPIEAARFAYNIPANILRKEFAFQKLKIFSDEEFERVKKKFDQKIKPKRLEVFGCDLFEKHVEGAKTNTEKALVDVNFFRCDATKISLDYDVIVTNPPYGLRIASKRVIHKLYEGFGKNVETGDWKRLVVMTAERKLLEKHLSIQPSETIKIMYGDLPTDVLVFER